MESDAIASGESQRMQWPIQSLVVGVMVGWSSLSALGNEQTVACHSEISAATILGRAHVSPEHRPLQEEISGVATVRPVSICGSPDHEPLYSVRVSGRMFFTKDVPRYLLDASRRLAPIRGFATGSYLDIAAEPARLWQKADGEPLAQVWSRLKHCAGCGCAFRGQADARGLLGGTVLPLCKAEHLSLLNKAIAGSLGGSSGSTLPPSATWTCGDKRLLYIITQYAGQSSPPTTRAAAESALAQVAQFYPVQSYQQTTVSSTVTDPIVVPQPVTYYESYGLAQLYNHAVTAARQAGWDADDYDFVFIRHSGGPGGVGVGLVGEKGAWVQTDNWNVLAHELGHNYGLSHANAWRPSTSSPYGPGANVEYGDPYDLMGPNTGSFNPYERSVLHWLPESARMTVTTGRVYRVHAFDAAHIESNRVYAIRVKKDIRDYWLDYRSQFQSGEAAAFTLNGLEIRWPQWSKSRGGSTLLDTTPGTPRHFHDGPLLLGRTLSDPEAGVHITVVDRSPVAGGWLDVAVQFTSSTMNQDPGAQITASVTNVALGEPVSFVVAASDPDGDPLAYGWETTVAGNTTPWVVSSNSPFLTCSWATAGRFEVRCTVSDMKGGAARVSVVVTVASPSNYSISGGVSDGTGLPLPDVRVFSLPPSVSIADPAYVSHPAYRSARTDDSGRFQLLNLAAETYIVRCLASSTHTFQPSNSSGQVSVGPDVENMQFLAVPKPLSNVRGFVRDGSQTMPNVMLQMGGQTTVSRADGSFVFSNMPPASYVLTSPDEGQYISPSSPIYVNGADLDNNSVYRVLYSLRGTVPGGIGLVYITTGEPGRSVMALPGVGGFFDAWSYELKVPRGIWNLEATLDGFTFAPSGFTNPVVVAGLDTPLYTADGVQPTGLSNLTFSATPGTTYSIRGKITFDGEPMAGVPLSIGSTAAMSDSLGNYAFGGLLPGAYAVNASLPGYWFNPSGFSNPISVGPNATNIDFLAISTASNAPTIVLQPQSQTVNVGSNVTFSLSATGSSPLTYQWHFNDSPLHAGATNSSLTLTNVQDSDSGSYSVVVRNFASVTSSNAWLTVNHLPMPAAPILVRSGFQSVKLRAVDFLGSDPDDDPLSLLSAGPVSLHGGSVTTNADWVTYIPPPGFTNADSFPFQVSDGRGGISSGTATVVVTNDGDAPQNLKVEVASNGAVRIVFDGIPERTYSVEFTESLEPPSWQRLATVTADENGVFVYTDTPPSGSSQRFYRASWP